MISIDELRERAPVFEEEMSERHEECLRLLNQFLERFPFHRDEKAIDKLTPDEVYCPGSGDYFFYWVEHKLKPLGHIAVGSNKPYINAKNNLDKFKNLLKIVVDRDKSLAEKVDADWPSIKGLGGDRIVAKKIIFLYNSDKAFNIFKTVEFEQILSELGIKFQAKAKKRTGKDYGDLSTGEKWQLLTELLSEFRESIPEIKHWDNMMIGFFLYSEINPRINRLSQTIVGGRAPTPLSKCGLLFEPRKEIELLILFAMYHRELGFPYILRVGEDFPDMTVIDENGEIKNIEFELYSKSFLLHKHDHKKCDYIICWEDNWDAPDEIAGKIISLKDRIRDIIKER